MQKGFRQIFVLLLLVAVTSIYLNGTRIFSPEDQNSSYLTNLRYEGASNEWNHSMFGEQAHWANMDRYMALTTEYDSKRAYGLLSQNDQANYDQAFSQMAHSALREWSGYQTRVFRNRVADEMNDIPTWYAIAHSKSPPLVVAGVLAAAYSGKLLKVKVGRDMALETKTVMNSARFESQYFGWTDNFVGASVGSTYDNASRGLAMTVRKDVISGISVSYDHQLANDAIGMVYSTGF
jgi:hypothetical protein